MKKQSVTDCKLHKPTFQFSFLDVSGQLSDVPADGPFSYLDRFTEMGSSCLATFPKQ
jgi:hypothetical protein